ncbi:hypothetical protein [Sporosarcina sp. FSL K6-5500]|uniref:hypothetical protein n=1 Tax=Sporosarcina sp. FSL K6-5500 TaxID=2921558 RepID=UPI0030F899CE
MVKNPIMQIAVRIDLKNQYRRLFITRIIEVCTFRIYFMKQISFISAHGPALMI